MEEKTDKRTLKEVISVEDASGEVFLKSETSALRQRIDEDKHLIQRLQRTARIRKKVIVTLSICWFLSLAMVAGVWYYVYVYNVSQIADTHPLEQKQVPEVKEDTRSDLEIQAEDENDAQSQYELGKCYLQGSRGFEKDEVKGVQWIEKAAYNGYIQAYVDLGDAYASGKGKETNLKKAFDCYFQAASYGNAQGQYKAGMCYWKAEGVAKNTEKALLYLDKASLQDYKPAKEAAGKIRESIDKEKIIEAQNKPQDSTSKSKLTETDREL